MATENNTSVEPTPETKTITTYLPYKCGYCGSTEPMISPVEMYGPGATGWDCCPDCGGV